MREARLGDVVASMKNGIYKPASEYADDGMPCLRMYNIDAGSIVWRDIKRMRINDREFADYGLLEGDLLVNRVNSRELVGKAAYIPASLEPSVFESKNIRLRLDRTKALPKFINYQLFARGSRHFANNAQQVVGMASISQGQLADFPIVLTGLDEQRSIVAEIEKQFSRLDEAVANLQRVKANLRRYEVGTLQALICGQGKVPESGDRPELPRGWQWKALPELGELSRGKSKHRPRDDPRLYGGPYPFIQTGDVRRSGGRIREFTQTYSDFGLNQSRLWPAGTLCITIAANIAETGILTMPACFPDSVVGFLSDDTTLTRFVEFFMRTAREDLERFAPATAQKNINLAVLERVVVPVPPSGERDRIVAEVDRRLSIVREVEAAAAANLKRAPALKQSVLDVAFESQ